MALPMGAGFWQYTEEYHESNSSMPQQAPNANGNSYGSSLFRKKNRFGAGHDTPAADTAPLLTPPDRPATSSAHSRRGSRGSSITSLNDLKNPTLRRRSASLRKNPAAAASIEMLAPTTSRETRSVLPHFRRNVTPYIACVLYSFANDRRKRQTANGFTRTRQTYFTAHQHCPCDRLQPDT